MQRNLTSNQSQLGHLQSSKFFRFEHVVERGRTDGLKLTVHFAEHYDDDDATRILNFQPE